jgi:hypothetical protein
MTISFSRGILFHTISYTEENISQRVGAALNLAALLVLEMEM